MKKLFIVLLATSVLTFSAPVLAQAVDTSAPVAAHTKLTPEDRSARRAERRAKFKSMTPEERASFKEEKKEKWQEKYNNATPEQKAKMDEKKSSFIEKRKAKLQDRLDKLNTGDVNTGGVAPQAE